MAITRFNRRVVNPVARRFAGRIPPFATIEHTGRRSGTAYRTPIMAFRSADGFAIALTYGPATDWVRNVQAAGGCTLEYGRREYRLVEPRLAHKEDVRSLLPGAVRVILGLMRVNDVLVLRLPDAKPPAPSS
jgi:deazaflavin-dependent oxidoreductase (nitroreductase family)